jgi:5'-AMP-activated protein kinase catalytic alpha subunit
VHSVLNSKVAIKILEKDKIKTRGDSERVSREIKILRQVNHPHIVQLYEIIETNKQLMLVMELAEGGELFNYIVAKHRLNEHESCKYLAQILAGLEYLQKLRIVHRDLKPENLLLDHKKAIKIVDFGLSNLYQSGETLKTACGSPCYAAPEMIAGKRYHGAQVDVWSCGVILFAMLCGYLPFEDSNTSNLYKKIMTGDFKVPNWVSVEASDILRKILVTDPEKRYTIEKIRNHPWFTKHFNIKDVYQQEKPEGEEEIFSKLAGLGYNSQIVRENLQAQKHNQATAAYRILVQMKKVGKKLPEPIKLRRSQNMAEVFPEKIEKHSRNRTVGTSNSPVSYRPITSYAIPNSLLPSTLGTFQVVHRPYKNPTPRVKTPLNYVLDLSNTINLSGKARSPRLGTTVAGRRYKDF